MKKKYLYSLLATCILATGTLASCDESYPNKKSASKKIKKVYVYKRPALTVHIDTLNVSAENLNQITDKGAAGVFLPWKNTVIVYHFKPVSDCPHVIEYCENNNNLRRLYMRHEMEHARKQDLTHNTDRFSPIGRAEVAAINEIVAPAAEIIEAVDYHARTGRPLPVTKLFIARADSAITKAIGRLRPGGVNYNYQPVADAVIIYALESYLGAVNRGFYKYTIFKEYNRVPSQKIRYVDSAIFYTFNPDQGKWNPIWEFESDAGKCNPYKNASIATKQKLMQTVDSIICDVTIAGQFATFFKNSFSR